MKVIVSLIFAASLNTSYALPALPDSHYDKCDNKIDVEKGEQAGGPFFGLGLLMSMHFLAERYCGYKMPPLKEQLERVFLANSCGLNSKLFKETMETERRMRSFTLAEFVHEGRRVPNFSESDARKAIQPLVTDLGGCKALRGVTERPKEQQSTPSPME